MHNYYKVIRPLQKELIIDTMNINYSTTLHRAKELENLLLIMSYFSSEFLIPINVLYLLNNKIATFGDNFLQKLPHSHFGIFTADQFTEDESDKHFLIKESDILSFINTMNKVGFNYFFEGYYIWEYLFEQVREQMPTSLPKRSDSFFLFETISDCDRYINETGCSGLICG